MVNAMVWRLKTGSPWRDLPPEFGPWQTVYDRFNKWSSDGTLLGVAEVLLVELDNAGLVDWDLWCIDGSVIRASRAAAIRYCSAMDARPQRRAISASPCCA